MILHIPIVKNFSNLLQRPYTEKESWTEILMRLPKQYLELVSVFKEASRNFSFIFLLKKGSLKIYLKELRMDRKYGFNFRDIKKIFISCPSPFKIMSGTCCGTVISLQPIQI
jgi:hypothetical protein